MAKGDTIKFTWAGDHNVYKMKGATDYGSCSFTEAVQEGTGNAGPVTVTVGSTDEYFACKVGAHCKSGQKLHVTVGVAPAGTCWVVAKKKPSSCCAKGAPANECAGTCSPCQKPSSAGCLPQTFIPSSACYDNKEYASVYKGVADSCRAGGTATVAGGTDDMYKNIGGDLYFCSSGTATSGLDGWTCGCGSGNPCMLCSELKSAFPAPVPAPSGSEEEKSSAVKASVTLVVSAVALIASIFV